MSAPSSYARLWSGKTLLLSLVLLAAAALVATAFGVLVRPAGPPPLGPPHEAQRQPEVEAPREARAEVFTLTPTGFEPAEATLPAGDCLLVFNNRTGLDDFEVRLDRDGHGTLRQSRPPHRKRALHQMLKLTPGSYVVTETGHPEWTLRLTVTPH